MVRSKKVKNYLYLVLSNGDRSRVQNFGRRTGLWVKDCLLALCFMTFVSWARTFCANHWHESKNTWVLAKGSFQSRAAVRTFLPSFSTSHLPSPSPLKWSIDSRESTAATQLPRAGPESPDLGFSADSSASSFLWVLEWVACPISLTQNLHLWTGRLEWMWGSIHQDCLRIFY